jgi:hypothetical protein
MLEIFRRFKVKDVPMGTVQAIVLVLSIHRFREMIYKVQEEDEKYQKKDSGGRADGNRKI